jgi:AcrR family transcriptional regulator
MAVTPKPPGRFHHGDLRRALLDALAEALREHPPEALSLRDLARRAGVAHSAAAPHFGDKRGLLTAFATEGYTRLAEAQRTAMAAALPDPAARLAASGRGYLGFARRHPGHFRLMMRADLLEGTNPTLGAAQAAAWQPLAEAIRAGTPGLTPAHRHARMVLAWSGVHGFAALTAEKAGAVLAGDLGAEAAEAALIEGLVAACLRPHGADGGPSDPC